MSGCCAGGGNSLCSGDEYSSGIESSLGHYLGRGGLDWFGRDCLCPLGCCTWNCDSLERTNIGREDKRRAYRLSRDGSGDCTERNCRGKCGGDLSTQRKVKI